MGHGRKPKRGLMEERGKDEESDETAGRGGV
jgi:hypothetical protein